MQFSVSVAIVLVLVSASTAFGDYPLREPVRLIAYGFLVFSLWRQVFVLLRIQNEDSKIKRAREDALNN